MAHREGLRSPIRGTLSRVEPFIQDAPVRPNRYETDRVLRDRLAQLLPREILEETTPFFKELGAATIDRWAPLAAKAEGSPPRLVPFDAWGTRTDDIVVDQSWTDLVDDGQRIGIVAIPYEGNFGRFARIVQAAVVDLFGPVSATADCPLSMTDAAVEVLRREDPELAERFVPKLLQRENGWTSGQWMTEQAGGSDVGRTGTTARKHGDGTWTLHGTKWFTSATTADIALALARPEGAGEGSRALSLFLVPLRSDNGSWNGISVRRLKDKLGTKALPTAELDLDGTLAFPVGGIGEGVRKVGPMLNITRLHAALGSVSGVGDGLGLVRDYATRREAGGRPLRDLPLHRRWISGVTAKYEALHALAYHAAEWLGAAEAGEDPDGRARLLLPVAKLACARGGADLTSQIIESFGGAGYVEDTGIPRIHRDNHVNCIWEGTSSVIALDVLRVLRRGPAAAALLDDARRRVHPSLDDRSLATAAVAVTDACDTLERLFVDAPEEEARRIGFGLASTLALSLVVEHARWSMAQRADGRATTTARILAATPLIDQDAGVTTDDEARLAFDAR